MVSKKINAVLFVLVLAGAINAVAAPTIVTHFPIPSSSSECVAVNPSLNKIYVSGGAAGGQNVTVIDGSTFAQTTVGTGSGASVDTVNNQYWAGTVYGGSAIVRDGVTNATVMNVGLGYCPFEADVDSAHRRVWVGAQCGGDMVWAIDADTFVNIAGPINTGGVMGRIRVNPYTGRLYLYTSGGSKRVDPTTFAVTANAFGIVGGVNPVTNRLYAITGSTLQIIDGAPDPEIILASVPLSFTPIAGYPIGVNTALNRIYIFCHADNTLYTIDETTGAELGSVSLGTGMMGIAVDSTNGRIYMTTSTPSGPQLFVLQDVPPNLPPVADAGDNIQIPGSDQNQTTIQGTATDPEGDPLEYRWLDGAKVILDWSQVGENGEAYLNLGTLPCLSFGNHILMLEVREAREGGQSASDTMILTIASPASIVGWGSNWDSYGNWYGQASPPDGNDFVAISAGNYHSLALKLDGSIVGWGDNSLGAASPPGGNDFVAIAAGLYHSLALKLDGSIVAWGYDCWGQLNVPEGNDFVAIAAGLTHSLALKSNGSIVGWGDNYFGQASPPEGNDFVAIAAGYYHSLALKLDGSIVGRGHNWYGVASPPGGNDFVIISAGCFHSLALKSDGSIVGWGGNWGWFGDWYGQAIPPAGNDFIAIAAGGYHSLALKLQNNPPSADAGNNIQIPGTDQTNTTIQVITTDPEGDPLEYRWLEGEQVLLDWSPVGENGEAYLELGTIPRLSVGDHTLTLEVRETGEGGLLSSDTMILTIQNSPPVANAGLDQTVYAWIDGTADVNLDGSASYDVDNQPLTYLWSWTIDANTYEANGIKPTIELPVGQHIIQLIVNDGIVDSEPNEVSITVVPPVEALLWIVPKVLNCHSNQPRIMAMMRLPKGITKDQIDTTQPLLLYPGEIEAVQMWISRDFDEHRVLRTTICAWFDRNELMSVIPDNGRVEVAVVGRLKTGQYFFGSDEVTVICPGHWPWHRPWHHYRWDRWCRRPFNFRH